MGRLVSLSPANADETLAFLAQRPYENVYVSWLIATRQAGGGETELWREIDGTLAGACYFGPQIVPCAESPRAIDAFALRTRRVRSPRGLVGPRPAIERMWASAKVWLPAPSVVRESQPVYAVDRAGLRTPAAPADVRRATLDELDELVPHSAQMIAGENGNDPRNTKADFRGRTARIVQAGWWWRYRVDGALAFMCNVGCVSPDTAQIQGVWTPPGMRGRGYATLGLSTICDRLLDEHRTLSLYVNAFNLPAIALYERVGFTRVSEFATMFFH